MHLFYAPDISGETYILSEEESKHAIRVLRLVENDNVVLVDGKGNWTEATIANAHPKKCTLHLTNTVVVNKPRNFELIIAVAPTKNPARMVWFLEKATEIGVDQIIPLSTNHGERTKINYERWEKVLISAMKQSLKAHLPVLHKSMSIQEANSKFTNANHLIAHCRDGEKNHLVTIKIDKPQVVIYIGPEGDFSVNEITFAQENNYTPISLGEERLRTETAALSACQIANIWKYV